MVQPLVAESREVTLIDLFEANVTNFGVPAVATIVAVGALASLQSEVLSQLSYFPWAKFLSSLGPKALELLRIHLVDILGTAWQKTNEILEYRDKKKHPPKESSIVPLYERPFTCKLEPYLEVVYRGRTHEVPLEIVLTLTLKAATLEIQDATIKAVQSGLLEGSGSISILGVELMKKSLPPVALAGIVKLGKGIHI